VRGADVVFSSKQRTARRPKGFLELAPELVVEVVSSDDRWQDVRQKLEEYFSPLGALKSCGNSSRLVRRRE